MVTNEEHLTNLIVNAFHREMEVYGYQVNIDNYTAMLAALPDTPWPDDVAQWSSTEVINLPADMSDENVDLISDLQYRDRLRTLLRTERVEQGKARRVLNALKEQIGHDADAQILSYKQSQAGSPA